MLTTVNKYESLKHYAVQRYGLNVSFNSVTILEAMLILLIEVQEFEGVSVCKYLLLVDIINHLNGFEYE